jgi:chemotaxis protein methyltransferase CheR
MLRIVPGARAFARSSLGRRTQHAVLLRFGRRRNYTYTRFLRFSSQFRIFTGPVMDKLLSANPNRPLSIVVIGCSNGAEAYTVASLLRKDRPSLEFFIRGYDIEPEMVAKAREGFYKPEEVFVDPHFPQWFVDATFDRITSASQHGFAIKPELRARAIFEVANVLDPALNAAIGTADLIFAQNFLYHLRPSQARQAFANLMTVLYRGGALFIDGMDLGLRSRLTRHYGLIPFEEGLEEIHAEAYQERGASWPAIYWGLEPLTKSRRDWKYRYSTIFFRPLA